MADPIQTNVQVQDIPEYLRDYRSALLNAAFQSVFSKPYLEANLPRATWYSAGSPAASTGAGSAPAGGTTRTDTQVPEEGTAKSESNNIASALAMVSGQMPKLLGMVWDPKTRTYVPEAYKGIATRAMAKGGSTGDSGVKSEDIIEAYENLRKSMPVGLLPDIYEKEALTGGVTLPGGRNPFGGYRGPSQTSAYTTGTDFGTTLANYNKPPEIRTGPPIIIGTGVSGTGGGYGPLPDYGTGGTGGGATGGGSVVRGGGAGGTGGGGATGGGSGAGGVSGAPPIGTPASASVIPTFSLGAAGTTDANRGSGGYNPAQYATDQQAAGLASLLGGQVARTNVVGPVAPPPQNLIDLGRGAQLNAGLVQQALGNITVDGVSRARTPSEMTQSLAGLRAEIAAGGGDTSQLDRLIQQNTQAYSSGSTVSPIGQPAKPPASVNLPSPRGRDNYSQNDYIIQDSSLNTGAIGSKPSEQASAPPEYRYSSGRSAGSQSSRGSAPGESKPSLTEYEGTTGPSWHDLLSSVSVPGSGKPGLTEYEGEPVSGKSAQTSNNEESQPSFGYDRFAQPDLGGFYATLRNAKPEPRNSRDDDEYGMAGGGLARFEIGDDGKVRNYSRGGAVRKADGGGFTGPNPLGFGATHTPSVGGFGGTGGLAGFWNAANPSNQVGTPIFNPPPVYGSQRILGFGEDFGQYTPGTGFTSSRMTNQALYGAGRLPSVFTEVQDKNTGDWSTQLSRAGDFGKGVASLNYATDVAGDVASYGRDLAEKYGQQGQLPSYLMGMMPNIQKMGFEDAIKVAPITAPTLQSPTGVTAPQLQSFQLQAPQGVVSERTGVGAFGKPQAEEYMSPYQEAVTETQKREAIRQANMLKAGRSAAAVRAGAFGGSRQAIQEGMAEEALQRQLGDIEATGRQKAYESAQAQFERDRAASLASQQSNVQAALQAALANQQAGLSAGKENLGAQLGVQNLAAQQALQAQLANQQAGLTAGQANLQSALATQQLGTQAGLEAAKASQSGDLATWQMQLDAIKQASAEQEAARQRDFSNRLAALQQAQAGAAGLAGLGGSLMGVPGMAQQLELQRLAAMQQAGGAVDARTQQALDMAYQDYINQQNFPYQQMNFLQGIMSGVPVGMQVEGVQFQRPSSGGLAGLATAGAGLFSNYLQGLNKPAAPAAASTGNV